MAEVKFITVQSNLQDKARVALWEVHPDHPDGEVFIADRESHQVAETRRVREALRAGRLAQVAAEMQMVAAPPEPEPEPKRARR